jgi:hypothetical protein
MGLHYKPRLSTATDVAIAAFVNALQLLASRIPHGSEKVTIPGFQNLYLQGTQIKGTMAAPTLVLVHLTIRPCLYHTSASIKSLF